LKKTGIRVKVSTRSPVVAFQRRSHCFCAVSASNQSVAILPAQNGRSRSFLPERLSRSILSNSQIADLPG
jgi:hypothetical protein